MIRIRIERKVSKPGDWCAGKLHGFPQFNLADFLLDQPISKRVRKHRSVPEPIRFQSNTLPLTTPAGRNCRRGGGGVIGKRGKGDIFSPSMLLSSLPISWWLQKVFHYENEILTARSAKSELSQCSPKPIDRIGSFCGAAHIISCEETDRGKNQDDSI